METPNLICFNCVHFRPGHGGCNAFPNGIPDVILEKNTHSKPLKDQGNKIVFEPIKKK